MECESESLISSRMSGKSICLGVISRSIGANECLSVITSKMSKTY
jgi:hypothetical protein